VQYWLMKSEPDELSIDHLARAPKKKFRWDGVRNYQARNMMRDQMETGDKFFFAHSSCKVPGIAGIAEIVSDAYTDPTQFDAESHYFDADAKVEKPRWTSRDVRFVERFAEMLTLPTLRMHTDEMPEFRLLWRGNRLSVMPVAETDWNLVLSLAARGSLTQSKQAESKQAESKRAVK
jgi:predicted RNA-binding protein with PUA-like domain